MNNRLRIIDLFDEIRIAQRDLRISKELNAEEFILSSRFKINEGVSELRILIDKLESANCLFGNDCNTLLHLSMRSGNISVLDHILGKNGLEYNKQNSNGETALHIATIMNQEFDNLPLIIKILFKNEIDIKTKNKIGLSALDYAIYARDEPLIKLYISHTSMTKEFFFEACHNAIKYQHHEALEFMLKEQACLNPSLFHSNRRVKNLALDAIRHGYINVAVKLYEIKPEAFNNDNFLLKYVTHENKWNIQENTSILNAPNKSGLPILEIKQAKLFFAAKYHHNHHRKRVAILEQDDDLPDSREYKQFLRYLKEILKQNQSFSARIQFIITSKHWISGDIKVNKGKISVLFIDPLGGTFHDSLLDSILMNSIRRFHVVFPEAEIFASVDRLQRKDFTSCTLFSIDNAAHLFNADLYLKKASYNGDLYDYLREHIVGSKNIYIKDKIVCTYQLATLPLRMIRAMQSLKSNLLEDKTLESVTKSGIFARILKAEEWEAKGVVNKKNETMEQSVSHGIDDLDGKQINIRIRNKLNSTRNSIINYMGSVSSEKAKHDVRKFGVKGINKTLMEDSKKQLKIV